MLEIIDLYLKNEGFIESRESDGKYCSYRNSRKGIDVFIDLSRCTAQLNSEKISVSINCELDQIFDIIDKVLEDPWKYQKHLFRNFLDCVDYFDEHYDKELLDLGLKKSPCIQTAENHDYNTTKFRTRLELRYEYSYYRSIWFPYHPGIESIITYLDYDDVEYIDMMRVKDENVIKKIIMYHPEITHLVDGGTKDRYLEFKKYREELREGYEEKIVYINEFIKKYPIEWLGEIRCIGRRIIIV